MGSPPAATVAARGPVVSGRANLGPAGNGVRGTITSPHAHAAFKSLSCSIHDCLLGVGLFALLAIVGMTIWLNEHSQAYFREVIDARDIRGSAVELQSALQTAEASQRGFLLSGNEIYL
ncbi:MAG: hypothetical protein GEV13_28720 [Rhodospirillales bacterium]|nr:hypothetical protein [Rhodospirillales bacterium]